MCCCVKSAPTSKSCGAISMPPKNPKYFLLILVLAYSLSVTGLAQEPIIPYCGAGNAGPRAPQGDGNNRPCEPDGKRHYVPHNKGIGFDILDSESQACFVPDQSYRLLDDLVDTISKKVKYDPTSTSPLEQATMMSAAVSAT